MKPKYILAGLISALLPAMLATQAVRAQNIDSSTPAAASPSPGAGREAITNKLSRIRFDSFASDGLPLSEVVRFLSDQIKKLDPAKKGINFLINPNPPAGPPTFDPQSGLPQPAEAVDLNSVAIRMNLPLRDVSLADVLNAVVLMADHPIKYTVEDYGIIFSFKGAETPEMSSSSNPAKSGGMTETAEKSPDISTMPPVVVKTEPEAGSKDVPPGQFIVHVTFSKEMTDQSWSWSTAWKDSAPEIIGKPKYSADHKVCAVAVKLEPGKTYGWWLNSQKFHGFQDTQNHPAVPYLLTFQTALKGQLSTGQPASADGHIDPATGLPASKPGGLPPTAAAANASYTTASEVHDLIANGQYEDALQRCLTFHDQYKANGALIPLLSDWVELGRRFPEAKQALIEIRDHDVSEFSAGRGYSDLFSEVNSINGYLNQDDATYQLFNTVRKQDPKLAQQCYFYVESLLVAKGEYQWCYDHMGDPQFRYESIRRGYEMEMANQKRMAETQQRTRQMMAEMNQKNGWTNRPAFSPPDTSSMIKKSAENRFIGQTRQLIEILVATGHKSDAERIRDQAVAVLDDPRLQSAITETEKKLQDQRAQGHAGSSAKLNPSETTTALKALAPMPSANNLPGTLTFHGHYKHRSRGGDIEQPSELWLNETPDGDVTALAQLPFNNSIELADGKQHRIASSASGNQPAYQIDLGLGNGQAQLSRRGIRQDCDGKELKVPAGAWFDPNTRPDSYSAANVLLRAFAVGENETKEFRAYDWDNTGEALVDYTIRVKHAGKERVEVPAGTFEANHLVLTQLTSAETWFKKTAGHVTDFWVLDNHVIVRALRHREPYEVVLLDYGVPEKLPGQAGKL